MFLLVPSILAYPKFFFLVFSFFWFFLFFGFFFFSLANNRELYTPSRGW